MADKINNVRKISEVIFIRNLCLKLIQASLISLQL